MKGKVWGIARGVFPGVKYKLTNSTGKNKASTHQRRRGFVGGGGFWEGIGCLPQHSFGLKIRVLKCELFNRVPGNMLPCEVYLFVCLFFQFFCKMVIYKMAQACKLVDDI